MWTCVGVLSRVRPTPPRRRDQHGYGDGLERELPLARRNAGVRHPPRRRRLPPQRATDRAKRPLGERAFRTSDRPAHESEEKRRKRFCFHQEPPARVHDTASQGGGNEQSGTPRSPRANRRPSLPPPNPRVTGITTRWSNDDEQRNQQQWRGPRPWCREPTSAQAFALRMDLRRGDPPRPARRGRGVRSRERRAVGWQFADSVMPVEASLGRGHRPPPGASLDARNNGPVDRVFEIGATNEFSNQ